VTARAAILHTCTRAMNSFRVMSSKLQIKACFLLTGSSISGAARFLLAVSPPSVKFLSSGVDLRGVTASPASDIVSVSILPSKPSQWVLL